MIAPARTRAVPRAARTAVLAWYDAERRSLPFRGISDPYGVLVSELMAQQTQIARVATAWTAWMARFPTVASLAAAPRSEVIRQWAGLGYNRRAVNLHRAAATIVERYDGRVPSRVEDLLALPGVGPYTARAVAAIAFGAPVGAVDVNIGRVLARAVGSDGMALGRRELQAVADASVDRARPADWTAALMDVGARYCRPRDPRCTACPLRRWCRSASRTARGASPDPLTVGLSRRAAPDGGTGPGIPFERTTRWLRGRIVARAREASDWIAIDEAFGIHDGDAVRRAVRALGAEGLLEVDATGEALRIRLPAE